MYKYTEQRYYYICIKSIQHTLWLVMWRCENLNRKRLSSSPSSDLC